MLATWPVAKGRHPRGTSVYQLEWWRWGLFVVVKAARNLRIFRVELHEKVRSRPDLDEAVLGVLGVRLDVSSTSKNKEPTALIPDHAKFNRRRLWALLHFRGE
jgi:hypothetical protein